MADTKTRIRGVDTCVINLTRSKTVPGAFEVTLIKTYRADELGAPITETRSRVNVSLGEAMDFINTETQIAYF